MIPLRPARSEDYAALCALWRLVDELHARLLPGYFRRPPAHRAPRTRDDVDKILRAPDEAILVADAGLVVGLVHAQLYDTPPVASMVPKRRAHIDNLVVDDAWRRQGIGRRLLDAATEWARARGAEEVLLTVWEGNDEAMRFYEAVGFGRINTVLGRRI